MELLARQFRVRLKRPFRVSRETWQTQEALLVELRANGHRGFGEATAFAVYGATIERMTECLKRTAARLKGLEFKSPEALWEQLAPELAEEPFARCAVDVAAHDLWGRMKGQPLAKLWGLDAARAPTSCFSIGMCSTEETLERMRAMPGWPLFKLKVGGEQDIERVRAVRQETVATLVVDANGGWTPAQTLEYARALHELGVVFIEQPLRVGAEDEVRALRKECPLPLIADESCTSPESLERCAPSFAGINFKLMKCGGITPARRMIARARELGLIVSMGCMPETSFGISALAQLAPLLDYADLDSILHIDSDLASGVELERGRIIYPDRPGTGAEPLPGKLEELQPLIP